MADQIGRNDPCPCGSGKKHKKCCMPNSRESNPASEIRDELKDIVYEQKFGSLDEANRFVKDYMEKRNSTPVEEFQGLSSHEMHRLLHFPFESPDVVRFDFDAAVLKPEDAPLTHIVKLIAEAAGEKGLKATATGNLPQHLCRDIAKKVVPADLHDWLTMHGQFRSENDTPYLAEARTIAGMAGFIRKVKGKFTVSAAFRKLIEVNAWPQIYEKIFMTFIREFNWAYPKSILEVPFFQQSFAFTLFLFDKFGDVERSAEFYEDCFLTAFPMLTDGIPQNEHTSAASRVKMSYGSQVIYMFGEISGLLQCRRENFTFRVTATPLLRRLVRFHKLVTN